MLSLDVKPWLNLDDQGALLTGDDEKSYIIV
jgi:hypothetical protein